MPSSLHVWTVLLMHVRRAAQLQVLDTLVVRWMIHDPRPRSTPWLRSSARRTRNRAMQSNHRASVAHPLSLFLFPNNEVYSPRVTPRKLYLSYTYKYMEHGRVRKYGTHKSSLLTHWIQTPLLSDTIRDTVASPSRPKPKTLGGRGSGIE